MTQKLIVIKRDGRTIPFEPDKIFNALKKASNELPSDETIPDQILTVVQNSILNEIYNRFKEDVKIYEIQNIVEHELMSAGLYDLAELYVNYRLNKDIQRSQAEDINYTIGKLLNKDQTVVNENANKDSDVFNTQRDLTAGIVGKSIGLKMLPAHVANAHQKGDIHYHDLDYNPYTPMTNCCLIDFEGMLKNGFKIGNAEVESPKSIQTATAQISQIIANVASSQYGGCTADRIDEFLAPYAELNYQKHLQDAEEWVKEDKREEYARTKTKKDIYDAMQSLEYEINTLFTSNGQTPFTSLGFGLGTNWFEREIQKAILEIRIKGLGSEHRTAIFPKLIFTVKRGLNLEPGSPNYDIKQLAIECATKRMYPDMLSYDKIIELTGSFKAPMGCVSGTEVITWKDDSGIHADSFETFWFKMSQRFDTNLQPNGKDLIINLPKSITIKDSHTGEPKFVWVKHLIRNSGNQWLRITMNNGRRIDATTDHPFSVLKKGRTAAENLEIGDVLPKSLSYENQTPEGLTITKIETIEPHQYSYDVTTESDYFDVSGIVSHNCRSFLQGWKDQNGKDVTSGRMNLGVVTVNLPRIALESNGDKNKFWEIFNQRMAIAKDALVYRVNRVKEATPANAPILYQYGAFGKRLNKDDEVDQLFTNRRATVSLGYIGLYEVATAFYGGEWEHNQEAKDFTVDIVKKMKQLCEDWSDEYNYHFSVYSTPSESLTDRFCRLDTEKFGIVKDITDKEYYTNSFHYDVRKNPSPFEKLEFERVYPEAGASGGFIHYCEYPVIQQNPKALEAVWDYAYDKIGYLGTNAPIDHCYKCNFEGDFDPTERGFKCPNCGNTDPKYADVVKRTCGYLGNPQARPMVHGRHKEISSRVKHMNGSAL